MLAFKPCNFLKSLRVFVVVLPLMLLIYNPVAWGKSPLIAYKTYGKGPEKVMVLHSWLDDASSFDLVKPYWDKQKYTFVFVELRGYGKSKKIKGEYSSTEASNDVFKLADKLDWDQFHVVGHSMSGMIVQRIALLDKQRKTNRVQSVVAISPVTANGFPADEETKVFLKNAIHNKELSYGLVQGLTGGKLPDSFYQTVVDGYMSKNTVEAMTGYYNMWINEDFSAEVSQASIEVPLLVVSGTNDLPGFQQSYYKDTFGKWYPNVSFLNIESAGHLPMYETPVYLAAVIDTFLSKN